MPPVQKQSAPARHRAVQRLRLIPSSRRLFESHVGTEIIRVGPGSAVR